MLQIVQNYKTGELQVQEVPPPAVRSGRLLVRNVNSLVSVGTEKQMIDLAGKSLVGKAAARPDLVKRVIDKAKTEGVLEAYRQAMSRLDTPVPLGYSSAGVVTEVGAGVNQFAVGDRVACAGSGYASHAEIVFVPENLCVKIPDGVSFEHAAFVTMGAIALHAVRMAEPQLGETVAVIGLGLMGQIGIQLLKAAGCRVFGIDLDATKVTQARVLGADAGAVVGQDDVQAGLEAFTKGLGADVVLIMASTSGNDPIQLAAELARDRGRIVAPGNVGLDVPRKTFYMKELRLIVSRSSGPGIYDPEYEERGIDYPISYVRWTEQRNMEAFLDLVAQDKVQLDPIITHRFSIEEAEEAYRMLMDGESGGYVGVLLTYPKAEEVEAHHSKVVWLSQNNRQATQLPKLTSGREDTTIRIGLIGAGQFANTTMLPAIKKLKNLHLRGVATATGASARHAATKFNFDYCSTDYQELLNDSDIDCILIATPPSSHAHLVIEALQAGKHVFVEKPLALNLEQLQEVVKAKREKVEKEIREQVDEGTGGGVEDTQRPYSLIPSFPCSPELMVGYNRRFSPFSIAAKELLDEAGGDPLVMNCRVNAGYVPPDDPLHDPQIKGGRIVSEVCHFVDLLQFFSGGLPDRVFAESISSGGKYLKQDNLVINVKLSDGSVGSITYTAGGDKAFSRERVEVFGRSAACVIDNFKSMTFSKNGDRKRKRGWNVDRGHQAEFQVFFDALRRGGPAPVDFTEYIYTTLVTFAVEESLQQGVPVTIDPHVLHEGEKGDAGRI